jgi:TolB-like protein/Tfp pilus assembly protein PilF
VAARRICEALRAAGVEVWFDQSELRGGDAWDQNIRRQIRDCALFVPIISARTQARLEGYFRREWKMAVDRTHDMAARVAFLIPVVIDETTDREAEVPDDFRKVQWTRLPDGATPAAFAERIAVLAAAKGTATRPNPAPQLRDTAPSTAHPLPQFKSRSAWLKALIAVISLAALAIGYVALHRRAPPEAAAQTGQAAGQPAAAPNAVPDKSIAVLPFVDMSEKRDQEYFSDGLSEELIDLLAKGTDMHVAARTSAFSFKGKQATIPEIAKALDVANVLEGSVRKAGQTLRVSAQLIRASDGYHIWSDSYERELKDVFKVQDEIAAAVVTALKAQLSAAHTSAAVHRTSNIDAYDEYLLGKQAYRTPTAPSIRASVQAYRRAISLDPQFAAAYAGLADAELYLAAMNNASSNEHVTDAESRRAIDGADRAIALDPDLAEGYSARGMAQEMSWNWSAAEADLRKAIDLDPHYSTARRRHGRLLAAQGRIPEAIAAERQAIEGDPLDAYAWAYLSEFLLAANRPDESRKAELRAIEINPVMAANDDTTAYIDLIEGKPARLLQYAQTTQDEAGRLAATAIATHALGRAAESTQALDALVAKFASTAPETIAEVYAWLDDTDQAFRWLARAYETRDSALEGLNYRAAYAKLRSDPRYAALLRKMNLPVSSTLPASSATRPTELFYFGPDEGRRA